MQSNEIYKEVLVNVLSKEEVNVNFPQLSDSMDKIVELNVINTLEQIVALFVMKNYLMWIVLVKLKK